MEKREHDLIVIGAGPGGYVAAIRAAQLGLNVACVEKEPALGGTCLRVGCIPSKALLESSELFWEAKQGFQTHGIKLNGVELDLPSMLKRKQQVVDGLTKGVESLLKKNKITSYLGHGQLDGPQFVRVQGRDKEIELHAKSILIATGSKSATLPGLELNGDWIGTSTEALSYEEPPNHLIVIGAGYIGLELGSVWRRLGAKVTVVEYLDRILPGMDSEIAGEAKKAFEKQGIEFQLHSKVLSARREGDHCRVDREGADSLQCDRVLVAVGRVPNTDGLGLKSANIEVDAKGRIVVNSYFATSAEGIYAIGDVIQGPMLAHKAEEEGIAFAEHLITGFGHVNYDAIPAVIYTQPEIASVGKSEEELQALQVDYRKGVFPFRANGRAHALSHVEGKIKMLADAKTDRILGVHILGPRAGDLIAEAAVAMNFGASSEDIARSSHAHPTLSEALREAALAVDKRAIHI